MLRVAMSSGKKVVLLVKSSAPRRVVPSTSDTREAKVLAQERDAAAAFADFAESFTPASGSTTFVRGGVIQQGAADSDAARLAGLAGQHYRMVAPAPRSAQQTSEPVVPQHPQRKAREMDTFLEELRAKQEGGLRGDVAGGMSEDARGGGGGGVSSGDNFTTNVLVSNLAPTATEEILHKLFSRYGAIESVKVMWPRTDEERARGRNTGFVLFYDRNEAERAVSALQDTEIEGQRVFLGWGRMPTGHVAVAPAPPLAPPPPALLPVVAAEMRERAAAILATLSLKVVVGDAPASADTADATLASTDALPPSPAQSAGQDRASAAHVLAADAGRSKPEAPRSHVAPVEPRRRTRPARIGGGSFISGWDNEPKNGSTWAPAGPLETVAHVVTADVNAPVSSDNVIVVVPPEDRLTRHTIDLWSEYVAKDGAALESLLLSSTSAGDEDITIAFPWITAADADNEDGLSSDALYYRWRVYSLLQGDTLAAWRTRPFQLQAGGVWLTPPPCPLPDELQAVEMEDEELLLRRGSAPRGGLAGSATKHESRPAHGDRRAVESGGSTRRTLSAAAAAELRVLLDKLDLRRRTVLPVLMWAIEHADAAAEVVATFASKFGIISGAAVDSAVTSPSAVRAVSLLYAVSDILHASGSAPVRNAWTYRAEFAAVLPDIFEVLATARRRLQGRLTSSAMKSRVARVISHWFRTAIFPPSYLNGLESTFSAPHDAAATSGISATSDVDDELRRAAAAAGVSSAGGVTATLARMAMAAEFARGRDGAAAAPIPTSASSSALQLQGKATDHGASSRRTNPTSLLSIITAKGVGAGADGSGSAPFTGSAWSEITDAYGDKGADSADDDDGDIDGVPLGPLLAPQGQPSRVTTNEDDGGDGMPFDSDGVALASEPASKRRWD